jgi:hypothetical protein
VYKEHAGRIGKPEREGQFVDRLPLGLGELGDCPLDGRKLPSFPERIGICRAIVGQVSFVVSAQDRRAQRPGKTPTRCAVWPAYGNVTGD